MASAIDVREVRKVYPRNVTALDGVSFTVSPGEIVGLLGPNGAGKSTTLRILTTLSRADKGDVRLLGMDVRREHAAVRRAVGYVPQSSSFADTDTPAGTLKFYSALYALPRKVRVKRQSEFLQTFGLQKAATRPVRKLSGGMRRRVDLAAALMHEPPLLIMDEPTAGLDPASRSELWAAVSNLVRERGTTVLFTTHYLDEADRYSDRVLIMNKGRLVAEGKPEALKASFQGDRILVRLADAEQAERARALLAGSRAAADLIVEDDVLNIRVADARAEAWTVLDALSSAGFAILGTEFRRPSLDDVYLQATGRSFPGDSAAPPAAAN